MMKKNKVLVLLICLSFSLNVSADPILLQKGNSAPYDGLLFSEQKANDLRKELLDKDYLKLQNDSLNRSLELYKQNESIYKEQKELLLEQNDRLAKSLYEERRVTNWERVGFFVLGIAATGLAFYGVSQLK